MPERECVIGEGKQPLLPISKHRLLHSSLANELLNDEGVQPHCAAGNKYGTGGCVF